MGFKRWKGFFFFESERFVVSQRMFPREEEVGIDWSILDFFFDYFLFENGGSVEDSRFESRILWILFIYYLTNFI